MKTNTKGFTLIELIMVIVILGILSAFALPRFADFGGSARQATLEGAAGAVRSAAGIARSQYLISGVSGGGVTLDGTLVVMSGGYPTANSAGIGEAAQLSSEFTLDASGATDSTYVVLETGCHFLYTNTDGSVSELSTCQ